MLVLNLAIKRYYKYKFCAASEVQNGPYIYIYNRSAAQCVQKETPIQFNTRCEFLYVHIVYTAHGE